MEGSFARPPSQQQRTVEGREDVDSESAGSGKTARGGAASKKENQKAMKETHEDGENTKRRTHYT